MYFQIDTPFEFSVKKKRKHIQFNYNLMNEIS